MNDIVLMVNYKANQIINYFENGSRFKVNLTFLHDNPKFSGTGGALLNAFFSGIISEDETLLIYYKTSFQILTSLNFLIYIVKQTLLLLLHYLRIFPYELVLLRLRLMVESQGL